jgi:ParB/RepB/Spo0J family partition protein
MPITAAPEFRQVPIGCIDEPVLPSRTTMDEQLMDELTASIRSLGFISVLVVVAIGDRFRVVAGHRRTIAARRAGVAVLPCFVYPSEGAALDAIQHAENRHREALTVTDEAIWFAELLEKYPDEGTDGVAARVHETRNYVEGRLLLLRGCARVFEALAEHHITIGVARELNRCTEDAHRFMLLDRAALGGATQGLVSQWVNEWRQMAALQVGAPQSPAGPPAPSPVVLDDYFTCRVCGERDNAQAMRPVNVHDFCLRQVLDPRTGLLRDKTEYVLFPRTREDAAKLVERIVERFPELLDGDPARA